MVFLNADNNLEPFALRDFEEMAKVGSNDKLNIVVQFDRSPAFSSAEGDWKQTLRFRVTKGMKPVPSSAIEDLGEVNMGDGKALSDFIIWAKNKYPAKRYMLDIWNHGQGWRVYQPAQARGPEDKLAALATARKLDRTNAGLAATPTGQDPVALTALLEGTVRSVSNDDTDNDVLYNREVQDKLKSALGGHKLDLFAFDACLMGMVETAFALREVAMVMVGSEELEPGDGWDYQVWLEKLAANPAIDGTAQGIALVEAYKYAYQASDPATTLSAVDLSQMDSVASAISTAADALRIALNTELVALQEARRACFNYAPGYGLHGIDLGRFCEQAADRVQDPGLRASLQAVRAKLNSAVVANYVGSGRKGGYGSMGLAIYFPRTQTEFDFDRDREGYLESNTHFPVEFVQAHKWDDFLHAYLNRNP